MRALRVVGLTEDGEVVLEDPVRLERFRVPADERLRAAARGDLSRLGQIAIELESQLRPREIQARIRAGASVEQVAAAAGVPEQKIERFAYPVLLERFRTAENAQRAHPVRADGPDSRTLTEVVENTFGLRGQAYEGSRWDSWKGEDGRWVVALSWRAGRSDNRAHWTFQPGAHGGTVSALDEHASDLVEGLPARPLRTVGAVVDMARPEEEPPPTSSPVEQWRAAASDSYRERLPHVPEPARAGGERGSSRPAPEPWRPAPTRREPVVPEQARPAAEYAAPPRSTGEHPEPALTEPRRAEPERVQPDRAAASVAEPSVTAPSAPGPSAAGPFAAEPSAAEPSAAGPSAAGPSAAAPSAAAGSAAGPSAPEAFAPVDREPTESAPEPAPSAEPASPTVRSPAEADPAAAGRAPARAAAAAPAPSGTGSSEAGSSGTGPSGTGSSGTGSSGTGSSGATAAAGRDQEPAAAEPGTSESEAADPPAADPPAAEAPAGGRRNRKGKPVMPSWDEVLLGVRGPR